MTLKQIGTLLMILWLGGLTVGLALLFYLG